MVRTSAVVLAAAVVVCYGGIWGGYRYETIQRRVFEQQQREVSEMRRRQATVAEDKRRIQVYYPRFKALQAKGILIDAHNPMDGHERLLLVKALRKQAQRVHLSHAPYVVSPPAAVIPGFSMQLNRGVELFASKMTLTTEWLHEAQLLSLIDGLERMDLGLFTVDRCQVERLRKEIRSDTVATNLKGSCDLLWFNIRSRSGGWYEKDDPS
ncbi:MAG: hypothetical protein H7835_12620 [Magnetococcus sp. XQGC-1]